MTETIGIVAGRGALPEAVARSVERAGQSVFVLRLAGMADPALSQFPGTERALGQIGHAIEALKTAGCARICFIGKVDRPDLTQLNIDAFGLANLEALIAAARTGDDALMRAVAGIFEAEGLPVVGLERVAGDLIAPPGALVGETASGQLADDLKKAFEVAGVLGAQDIGQACVVCEGVVLAVEAQEGTDHMLSRIIELPLELRGTSEARRGVLVKRAKPGQDRRLDLPVIGPGTVDLVAAAGLAAIGVEAGASLISNRTEVIRSAEHIGLGVFGLGPDGSVP